MDCTDRKCSRVRAHRGKLRPVQTEFGVDVHSRGRTVVLELFGELDIASSTTLEAELERNREAPTVVVDLRRLEFIDSTGLGVLVRAHRRALEQQRDFQLIRGTGQVERLLVITGVADQLPVSETAEDLTGGS